MPIARFCPQCGTEMTAIEREGRLRPVCPACGYIHYVNPVVAAGALVERDGEVLLVRRGVAPGRGRWGLPAGYAEAGESPEQTAARETLEETGAQVELGDLLGVYAFSEVDQPGGVLVLYAARMIGGTVRPGDDATDARFFGARELPDLAFSTHRHALAQWSRSRRFDYRELTPGDRDAWEAFWRAQGTDAPGWPDPLDPATDDLAVVAADGNQLAGVATLSQETGSMIIRLHEIQVLPALRRWGIGTHLLNEAVAVAAARGAGQLLAEIPADHPALVMFIHGGFRVCGFVERARRPYLYLCHDLA